MFGFSLAIEEAAGPKMLITAVISTTPATFVQYFCHSDKSITKNITRARATYDDTIITPVCATYELLSQTLSMHSLQDSPWILAC